MIELILSALMARYRSLSLPIICSCPTTSSKVLGRILAASGASFSILVLLMYSNKSIILHPLFLLQRYQKLEAHSKICSSPIITKFIAALQFCIQIFTRRFNAFASSGASKRSWITSVSRAFSSVSDCLPTDCDGRKCLFRLYFSKFLPACLSSILFFRYIHHKSQNSLFRRFSPYTL